MVEPERWWRSLATVAAAAGLVAVTARPVAAQADGWLAVGGGIVTRQSQEAGVGDTVGPAFILRVGRGGTGWGMRYGFDWFSTDVERPIAGQAQSFGRLRVRPLLAGYGYSLQRGLAQVSFNLKGGYAFSSFRMQPSYSAAYGSALQTTGVRASAGNTFVLKPEVSLWLDVSRKIGVNISSGYMVARPQVVVSSASGSDRRRVTADMLVFQVGAAYTIF